MAASRRWWVAGLALVTVPALSCHVRMGQRDPAAHPRATDSYVKPYATSPAYEQAGGNKGDPAKPASQAGSAAPATATPTSALPTHPPQPVLPDAVPDDDELPPEVPDEDLLDEPEEVEIDEEVLAE